MTKYHAKRTTIDGITFASKAEAKRYSQLKLLERAGEIRNLELQPSYDLEVNGILICRYVADFRYVIRGGQKVEDVKGVKTPVYKIKKKLMKAIHNINIREV